MDWSQASDAELLAATTVNVDAFAAFYDRYETPVVGYLLKPTGDIELAQDLGAEVFAAALVGARRYRSQRDSAAPWLFTIAHSKLADSARRRLGIRDRIEYGDDELDRIESILSQSGWATDLLQRGCPPISGRPFEPGSSTSALMTR